MNEDEIIRKAMSIMGKKRWESSTPEERAEHARMMGKKSAKVPKKALKERTAKAGKASWAAKTPEERAAHIAAMQAGRKHNKKDEK